MAVQISGWCLGVPLSFDVADDLAARLAETLPHGWQRGDRSPEARTWTVSTEYDIPGVLSDAELHVAERVAGLIAIHAGVVAFDGRAIVLPGRTLTGKSTLTEALVRHGGTYYSDEYALLDDTGRVHPYARPLTLRASSTEAARLIDPATLAAVGEQPAVPRLVAQLRYASDAQWDVQPITAGEGTLVLIDNAVAARTRAGEVLAHCAAAARAAHFLRGARGAADAAAEHLIALVTSA
jgi:hypothetical protein